MSTHSLYDFMEKKMNLNLFIHIPVFILLLCTFYVPYVISFAILVRIENVFAKF